MSRVMTVVLTCLGLGVSFASGMWTHSICAAAPVATEDVAVLNAIRGVLGEIQDVKARLISSQVEVAASHGTIVPTRDADAPTEGPTSLATPVDAARLSGLVEESGLGFYGWTMRKPNPDVDAIRVLRNSPVDVVTKGNFSRVSDRIIMGLSYSDAVRAFGSPTRKTASVGHLRQDSWIWDLPGTTELFVIEFAGGVGMSGYFSTQ